MAERVGKAIWPLQRSRKNCLEIEGLNETLKKSLQVQEQHLESFGAAFRELASGADKVSNTNQSVLGQAENAAKESEKGLARAQLLKEVSRKLSESQNELSKLNESMKSIKDAATLINEIVFQTRLLAFNAAIEATHAGSHGKGFSVVADEVRRLAESSATAATAITNKIEAGIYSVDGMVSTLTGEIVELIKITETTFQAFGTIKEETLTLATAVREVSQSTMRQSIAVNDNLATLEKLTELSHESRSIFKQVDDITTELSRSAAEASAIVNETLNLSGDFDGANLEFLDGLDKILRDIRQNADMESALETLVNGVAKLTQWKIAHVLEPDEQGATRSMGIWSELPGDIKASLFYKMSSQVSFEIGKGLPGRVYKSKHLEWIEDVATDNNFPRSSAAREIGLVSAMGVPIISRSGEILVVVEYFSFQRLEPDELLMEALQQMGQILGTKSE